MQRETAKPGYFVVVVFLRACVALFQLYKGAPAHLYHDSSPTTTTHSVPFFLPTFVLGCFILELTMIMRAPEFAIEIVDY